MEYYELLCYYNDLQEERFRLYDRYMNDEINEDVLKEFEEEVLSVERQLSKYKMN
jgi:hypothetical protein